MLKLINCESKRLYVHNTIIPRWTHFSILKNAVVTWRRGFPNYNKSFFSKMNLRAWRAFLYNLALTTHDATKCVNPSISKMIHKGFYSCQLFCSKMHELFHLHRIWISEDFPTASEDFRRLPKIAQDFQQLPKIADDVERFSMTSKQLLFTEKLNFYLIGFKQLHLLY